MILRTLCNRLTMARFHIQAKDAATQTISRRMYILSSSLNSNYSRGRINIDTASHLCAISHRYSSILLARPELIRYYGKINREDIDSKIAKSKQMLTDNIEEKRLRMRERKESLVQGIRDKKAKVQEKVKEMEEIVERENILTIPNFLCVARSFLAPYIGYIITCGHYELAFGLLAFAGITDLLDGFIARNWISQASKLGSFLDPMADKLLVGSLVISLSISNLFPTWLSVMVISRDVFLIMAGFVIRYISLPQPRTFARYFDATHVTAKLLPTFTSKVNTAVQLVTIALSLGAPVYGFIDQSTLQGLWYFAGATTVAAAASYIFTKNTYKLIKQRKIERKIREKCD